MAPWRKGGADLASRGTEALRNAGQRAAARAATKLDEYRTICGACGRRSDPNRSFCTSCGSRVFISRAEWSPRQLLAGSSPPDRSLPIAPFIRLIVSGVVLWYVVSALLRIPDIRAMTDAVWQGDFSNVAPMLDVVREWFTQH